MNNSTWIKTLHHKITTATHVEQFVSLWTRIQLVHLQPEREDQIKWKWTADGKYSARSAYRAQFIGTYNRHQTKLIWRAHTENKCKLFAWILIQNKILTSDNLALRGWPHQNSCALCSGPLETGLHLCLTCPYAQVVWNQISTWENFNILQAAHPVQFDNIGKWWEKAARSVPKDKRRHFNGLIIYTMWNIWKERNRRIFDQKFLTVKKVATRIKENLEVYRRVFRVIT